MDNKLAVCTWTFGPLPLADICKIAKQAGLDGIELYGAINQREPAEARRIAEDCGLEILSITPDNVDIAHPDDTIRQRGLDYYAALLDFAAAIGAPVVGVHGEVGRFAAVSSQAKEYELLVKGVSAICQSAAARNLPLVWEVLNRYESHLVNSGAQALALLEDVNAPNLSILLDAYHMNIEEARPADAVRRVGTRLGLFHVADSNRQGIGHGHTDMEGIMKAIRAARYAGPLVLECAAPGPNPYTPVKGPEYVATLAAYLNESANWLRSA